MAGVWGIFEGGTVSSGSGLAPAAGLAAVGTVEYKLTVRILAVDTTTARGSLAVVTESEVLAEARSTAPAGHSTWLLAEVESALGRLSLSPADLDGFAVATGPGSFTGLRVGLSSVQGLALATGRPCVGAASLDLLAESAAAAADAPTVVALVDAVRGEVFAGVYDRQGKLQGERCATRVADLAGELRGEVAFVGDGALRYRDDLERLVPEARFPEVELFLAPALGRWGIARLAAGEGVPPGDLRPLYLRGAHIRKPRA
jgi:tRNA threonylcarbamoyladenosine biosynthesis protein TsaB